MIKRKHLLYVFVSPRIVSLEDSYSPFLQSQFSLPLVSLPLQKSFFHGNSSSLSEKEPRVGCVKTQLNLYSSLTFNNSFTSQLFIFALIPHRPNPIFLGIKLGYEVLWAVSNHIIADFHCQVLLGDTHKNINIVKECRYEALPCT